MLLHDLLRFSAAESPQRTALGFRDDTQTYFELLADVEGLAAGLRELGLAPRERVAIWLPKQLETVQSLFATATADGCFVPINPVLKPAQVVYQLQHSDARVLITSSQRLRSLSPLLSDCPELKHLVLTDTKDDGLSGNLHEFRELLATGTSRSGRSIDQDMVGILYTSGSTGRPKGVVLSHRNMTAGAESVASYLGNRQADRILAVLPLSFDAGLSQITTAFNRGAYVHLMDYLLPQDVLRTAERAEITGITGVPSLWNPLSRLQWPDKCVRNIRYLANTGGAMPEATTRALAAQLPGTELFLMYGLTEAFRSTFLPPARALEKPGSVGQAIPNAQVLVVNSDGEECAAWEHGELVHRGAHVALGYWKNPEATAERFRPAPGTPEGLPLRELAVWSGDTAFRDDDGDIFFVARNDAMIKTSGYRVSPTEIEAEAYAVAGVDDVAAIGAVHPEIGQAIVLYVSGDTQDDTLQIRLKRALSAALPAYMLPRRIEIESALPMNPNGKIDRPRLAQQSANFFTGDQNHE